MPLRRIEDWKYSFTSQPSHPWGNNPGIHWTGAWVGPRIGLETAVTRGKRWNMRVQMLIQNKYISPFSKFGLCSQYY